MDDEIKNEKSTEEISEIDKIKAQAEEYLNNWKRERADFTNYKKEEARRVEEFVKYANEALLLEMIDILDNLELGLKYEPTELLKKLSKDFKELLKKYGVERIKTEGEKFDPALHEAVLGEGSIGRTKSGADSGISVEGTEGNKLEELRPGYTLHGKVIRPARVKLTK